MKDDGNFHQECFACSQTNEYGLQLQFESNVGEVTCRTEINKPHQSYNGVVHGGIIATLLDAAMVHCLHKEFGKNLPGQHYSKRRKSASHRHLSLKD